MSKVPRLEMKCVDVNDVAQAHVRSLYIPEAAGHRFILVDRPVWLHEIAQTLAEHYDGKNEPKLPIPTKEYSLVEIWIGSWFS
jgi:nucleoside-diphosphate-sugar epimerase